VRPKRRQLTKNKSIIARNRTQIPLSTQYNIVFDLQKSKKFPDFFIFSCRFFAVSFSRAVPFSQKSEYSCCQTARPMV